MVEVAEFFGVSHTVIRKDWRARGMPGDNGCYPLDEITRWKIEREREVNRGRDPEQTDLGARYDLAEVLKLEAEATIKAVQAAVAEGKVIDRETAMAEIEEMFNRVRARLEQIPQELGTTIPPEIRADLIADMRHKIGLVLREMEGWGDE